jgi:chorismate dehydratase
MRRTGYPVVFAVFAVRKESIPAAAPLIASVTESFRSSLAMLGDPDGALVDAAVRKYPEVKYDAAAYYRLLKYDFTPQMKEALMYYYSEAASMGLLEPVDKPEYYRP